MKTFKLTALVAMMSVAGVASAASVSSQLFPNTLLSDNSAEYLIKGANNTGGTVIEVGDSLRGIFNIETAEPTGGGTSNQIGSNGVNELTGIFQIEVTGVFANGDVINAGGFSSCTSTACFTFGASSSFATELGLLGWTNTAGATVAFYEDTTIDFDRLIDTAAAQAVDIAAMEATATGGNMFWLAGFGLATDFWTANSSTDDISVSSILAGNTPFGQFALGQSLLENPTGPDLGLVACTDVYQPLASGTNGTNFCGNGGLFAKGPSGVPGSFNTAYDSLNDVNFNIAVIPEPGTIALLGLGLLGMGASLRRRQA